MPGCQELSASSAGCQAGGSTVCWEHRPGRPTCLLAGRASEPRLGGWHRRPCRLWFLSLSLQCHPEGVTGSSRTGSRGRAVLAQARSWTPQACSPQDTPCARAVVSAWLLCALTRTRSWCVEARLPPCSLPALPCLTCSAVFLHWF